jgi:peroxiredoxin (alkyl hydroperoxide reductase subunit C)
MPLQVGQPAPPFEGKAYLSTKDEFLEVSLADYADRWLCLLFYPMDFSTVCPTELTGLQAAFDRFHDANCDILACSCDTHLVHKAWCDSHDGLRGLRYPLLADVTKRIAMDYGVLVPDKGIALRGTYLIDPHGVLRFMAVNELMIGRDVIEILRELDALQTNEQCPCNWKKGEKTLGE